MLQPMARQSSKDSWQLFERNGWTLGAPRRTWPGEYQRITVSRRQRKGHTLVLEFAGAARLALKLLTQLIQQLRQTRVGSGHHPAMSVVHCAGGSIPIEAATETRYLDGSFECRQGFQRSKSITEASMLLGGIHRAASHSDSKRNDRDGKLRW
jgi:hypothetical protein